MKTSAKSFNIFCDLVREYKSLNPKDSDKAILKGVAYAVEDGYLLNRLGMTMEVIEEVHDLALSILNALE